MERTLFLIAFVCILLVLLLSNRKARAYFYFKKIKGGLSHMEISEMLKELVGKYVYVTDVINGSVHEGDIVALDEKWMRLERTNKKGEVKAVIVSVDSIGSITLK